MRQLTSVDAQFLALESARQSGHVGGLAILDPSTRPDGKLTLEAVHDLIAERLPLLPPLRWRLAEVPFGLDYPYWVDDPHFDLDFHVRELALSPPGNDEKLAEQVARIVARPLDRSRPLWEVYLIHGLGADRVAMLTKIHHSLVDGLSGAEIMGVLLDLTAEGREAPEPLDGSLDGDPSRARDARARAAGPAALPAAPPARAAVGAAQPRRDGLQHAARRGPGGARGGPGRSRPQPRRGRPARAHEPQGAAHELQRAHLAAPALRLRAPLPRSRQGVKNQYGCTVNDVVVSVCAGAVRRWLDEHGELVDEPLVAQIPVSVRTSEQAGTFGNRIMLMSAPLFTNVADPVDRLLRTHEALRVMKERHRALPAELLQDVNHFIPPAVFSRAARVTFALSSGAARPTWNLVISNVPGPQFPLYLAGAQLEAHYPVSVITDGMGLNITVMSYMGKLDFGIVADRDQMPDLWRLMDWLDDELQELVLLSA